MSKVMSPEDMARELAEDMLPPKTRGYYRSNVMAAALGRSNSATAFTDGPEMKVIKIGEIEADTSLLTISAGLDRRVIAVVEGVDKTAKLTVRRQGVAEVPFTVRLKTIEETAKVGKHFKPVDVLLRFGAGVSQLVQEVELLDNDIVDHEDVTFQVQLYEERTDDSDHKVALALPRPHTSLHA